MIVYARTKEVVIKGKDSNDNEQYLRVSGEGQDALKTESLDSISLLQTLLLELRRLNFYMSTIIDEKPHPADFDSTVES